MRKQMMAILGLGFFVLPLFAADYVKIDGSSTVYPITEGVAEDFQKQAKDVRVTVGISGTGGGFKKFCKGETDISDASRPIRKVEIEMCKDNAVKFIELPVAMDGLTVIVNPKNTWVKEIKVSELKKMWQPEAQGKITRWNQINPKWPDQPFHLYGPGVDSGTYDYFTEAIVGKEHSSRGDYTSSEDDNVLVQGIANDPNALGFFGMSYYENNMNKLKALAVDNEKGKPAVIPNYQTVVSAEYQPLSRPLFIYVNAASLKKPEIKNFVEYYLKNALKISKEVGYVALPPEVYQMAQDKLNRGKTGSFFQGKSKVGVTVHELVK